MVRSTHSRALLCGEISLPEGLRQCSGENSRKGGCKSPSQVSVQLREKQSPGNLGENSCGPVSARARGRMRWGNNTGAWVKSLEVPELRGATGEGMARPRVCSHPHTGRWRSNEGWASAAMPLLLWKGNSTQSLSLFVHTTFLVRNRAGSWPNPQGDGAGRGVFLRGNPSRVDCSAWCPEQTYGGAKNPFSHIQGGEP